MMIRFRTRLAELIATQEGFFKVGSLPARRHNPGDLRHAPHASHDGIGADDIGIEPSDLIGVEDLERQILLDRERGLSLRQFIYKYAPPKDSNNSEAYLLAVARGLGLPMSATLIEATHIPALSAGEEMDGPKAA